VDAFMRTLMIILIALSFSVNTIQAQNFNIISQRCYGGAPGPRGAKIIPNGEGFTVFATILPGNNHAPSGCPAKSNLWLYQIDANGDLVWNRCYGGNSDDDAIDMLKTSDNGFLLSALTLSNDGDVSYNPGTVSIWIIKTDSIGQLEWERCYGGSNWEWVYRIRETPDGGYIFIGWTNSTDGDISYNNGTTDMWVVKINSLGEIEWERCYGGSYIDWGQSIVLTKDGGYLAGGITSSSDGDVSCTIAFPGAHFDIWVLKLDPHGEIEWQNCYGGTYTEALYEIKQTSDGGYILLAATSSNDGDVSGFSGEPGNHKTVDMWVVKLDSRGNLEWQRCLGGNKREIPTNIVQLSDGGYLVGGSSESNNGIFYCPPCVQGALTMWLVKLSPEGEIEWTQYVDSPGDNALYDFHVFSDMHYLLLGLAKWPGGMLVCDGPFNHDSGYNWIVEIQDTTMSVSTLKPEHLIINVYPNPASTELWLQMPENIPLAQAQIEMFSPTGRLIYRAQPVGQFHKIETACLPSGLYMVRLWDEKLWRATKVVVK
jgi:hypothetical protein